MLRFTSAILVGLVSGFALLVSLDGGMPRLSTANAQTAPAKTGDCSSSGGSAIISQVVSGVPGAVLTTFVCVADLDGSGRQEIIVGNQKMDSGGNVTGSVTIVNNTGKVRATVSIP